MSSDSKHSSSAEKLMLPGMETKPEVSLELKSSLGEIALSHAQTTESASSTESILRIVVDHDASEAAQDQGHAYKLVSEPQPPKKPVARRRSTRRIESQYSDINSDLPVPTPRFNSAEETKRDTSAPLGLIAVKHILAAAEVTTIMDENRDNPARARAIHRARQEKRQG
jgi:hypothetical protein